MQGSQLIEDRSFVRSERRVCLPLHCSSEISSHNLHEIWNMVCRIAAEMIKEYSCIEFPNFGVVSLRDYKGGVKILQFGTSDRMMELKIMISQLI